MADYKSNPVDLAQSAESIYDKLTNLKDLGQKLKEVPREEVPEDKRDLLDQIEITDSTIMIPGGPTGNVTLRLGQCERPQLITFEGENTPVPVALTAHLAATGADSCQVTVVASIGIPAMLKPMVSGPMQKLVDQIAMTLTQLARH